MGGAVNPKIYREDFAKRLIELAGGEDGMELHDDGVYLTKEWVEETEEIKADWSPQGALPGSDPGSRKLLPIPFSTRDLAAFIICPAAAGSGLTDLCLEGLQPDPKKFSDAFTGAPGIRYADAMKEAFAHLERALRSVGPQDHALEKLAQSLCEQYRTKRRAARELLGIASVGGHRLSDEEYKKRIRQVKKEVAASKDKWDDASGQAKEEYVRWLDAIVVAINEPDQFPSPDPSSVLVQQEEPASVNKETASSDSVQVAPLATEKKQPGLTPLTTNAIAHAFSGLRWNEQQWKKPLGDKPKWLRPCVSIPGQPGVHQTHWDPVKIGAALVDKGYAKANQVRGRFQSKPALIPWLDEWKTYEADYLDID